MASFWGLCIQGAVLAMEALAMASLSGGIAFRRLRFDGSAINGGAFVRLRFREAVVSGGCDFGSYAFGRLRFREAGLSRNCAFARMLRAMASLSGGCALMVALTMAALLEGCAFGRLRFREATLSGGCAFGSSAFERLCFLEAGLSRASLSGGCAFDGSAARSLHFDGFAFGRPSPVADAAISGGCIWQERYCWLRPCGVGEGKCSDRKNGEFYVYVCTESSRWQGLLGEIGVIFIINDFRNVTSTARTLFW